jgi:hypothetical protein
MSFLAARQHLDIKGYETVAQNLSKLNQRHIGTDEFVERGISPKLIK